MKITMIYNTVYAFATQRNATQRNAYHNYILNNNFKFYIYQFFRTLEFLSGFIRFAKIISFIKETQNLCSFLITKKNHAKGGQSSKIDFFLSKRNKAKARFQRKTPFRIRNSLVKTFLQYSESPSLRGFAKNRSNLFFVDCHDFLRSLAMTIKNKFEIISQLDYGFCYKNYFSNLNQVFRNSYDFGEMFGRNLNYGFEKNYDFSFGKNYFGNCNFGFDFVSKIYSIGNNLAGFLFNRKIKK